MGIQVSLVNVAMAPPLAMGMVYNQGAQSISLLMQNAVFNEKLSQMSSQASLDQCLAFIIAGGAAGAAGKGE